MINKNFHKKVIKNQSNNYNRSTNKLPNQSILKYGVTKEDLLWINYLNHLNKQTLQIILSNNNR